MNKESGLDLELSEISELLQALVLAHEATGKAIERVTNKIAEFEDKLTPLRETKFSLEEAKKLIGRRVRILNPSKTEPHIGTVAAVGKIYERCNYQVAYKEKESRRI